MKQSNTVILLPSKDLAILFQAEHVSIKGRLTKWIKETGEKVHKDDLLTERQFYQFMYSFQFSTFRNSSAIRQFNRIFKKQPDEA